MNVLALKGLTNWSGRRGGTGISVVRAMIEIYKESWGYFEKRHLSHPGISGERMVVRKHFPGDVTPEKNLNSRKLTWEDIVLALNRREFRFFLPFSGEAEMGHPASLLDHKPHTDQNPNRIASGILLTRSSAFNYYK